MEMMPLFNLTIMIIIIMLKCLPARRPVLRGNALYVLPGGAKIKNKSMYKYRYLLISLWYAFSSKLFTDNPSITTSQVKVGGPKSQIRKFWTSIIC
jgi:hypothetical protein